MNTTNLKYIAYALSALMLMQSCRVYNYSSLVPEGDHSDQKKVKLYRAWVTLMDGTMRNGILYNANEEGIVLYDLKTNSVSNPTITPTSIKVIKIRKKGGVGQAALIGSLAGLLFGGLIGLISGDDPDVTTRIHNTPFGTMTWTTKGAKKEIKALWGGIGFAFLGGGITALLASKKEKIVINGNMDNYKRNFRRLLQCSIVKNSLKNNDVL
jgi:hypothetical protein